MVKLLVGKKGTGKTKKMIDMANERVEKTDGNIVFINKNDRLTYDLKHEIRIVNMSEYPNITNIDEYIGFLYGIISSDHDIEGIFVDSILKYTDIVVTDMAEFIARLGNMSKLFEVEFVVSLSADKEEIPGVNFDDFQILN